MVFRILTAQPTGEDPFGWKGVAAGETTVHAKIVRSETREASDLEAMVSDRIEARLGQGGVALELRYRRGVPGRVASEGRVRFASLGQLRALLDNRMGEALEVDLTTGAVRSR